MAENNRIYYQKLGICPRCHKNKLFGDERSCPECRAKNAERQLKWVANNKEKSREQHRKSNIGKYDRLKSQGLCVTCGKRKAVNGVRCPHCREWLRIYRIKQKAI